MKNVNDYLPELKNRIQKETGYKISERTLRKVLRFFLLNLSFELKDMKQIELKQMKFIPKKRSLERYYKLYPKQDILKISNLFKRDDVNRNRKMLHKIRKEFKL